MPLGVRSSEKSEGSSGQSTGEEAAAAGELQKVTKSMTLGACSSEKSEASSRRSMEEAVAAADLQKVTKSMTLGACSSEKSEASSRRSMDSAVAAADLQKAMTVGACSSARSEASSAGSIMKEAVDAAELQKAVTLASSYSQKSMGSGGYMGEEAAFTAELQKAIHAEHQELQGWLAGVLEQHRQVLLEHGRSLQALRELQGASPPPAQGGSWVQPPPDSPPKLHSKELFFQRSSSNSVIFNVPGSSRRGSLKSSARVAPGVEDWSSVAPNTTAGAVSLPGCCTPPDFGDRDMGLHSPPKEMEDGMELALQPFPAEDMYVRRMSVSSTNTADMSNGSDEDRAEWKRHLHRRVTEELDKKRVRRSTSKGFSRGGSKGFSSAPPVPNRCKPRCNKLQLRLQSAAESSVFQWVGAGVILVNVAFIGYTTNAGMANVLAVPVLRDPEIFATIEKIFMTYYIFELLLRLMAYGSLFFTGRDQRWNAFDSLLVGMSLLEEIVQGVDMGVGILRVIRGLRMFRVLRIIRAMRYCRDLRVMVGSIMQSLGSLSWSLLLLATIMYLFSVVFMQGAILHLEENGQGTVQDGVVMWYSSVFNTMYTLLASIIGGVGWVDVVRPLEDISMVYRVLFSFYVVFVVIGVLNVLTGIFVERACELSGLDKDLVIQTEMKRNECFLEEMKRIFEEADADGSGTISWEEFKVYLTNDRVKAYLSTQQLDAFDARTLFDLLSEGGQGNEMTIESFIVGCQRVKGIAKSVDLLAVLQETRAVNKRVKAMMRQMDGPAVSCVPSMTFARQNTGRLSWTSHASESIARSEEAASAT